MSYVDTLRKWLPRHFREDLYEPNLLALGLLLDNLNNKIDEFFDETLISQSVDTLELHGLERGLERVSYLNGRIIESDEDFKNRIQRLKYTCSDENISQNVLSVSFVTDIEIIPDYKTEPTGDETDELVTFPEISNFGNYGPLDLKKRWKCFSLLIGAPERPPYSYLDKGGFLDKNIFLDEQTRILDEISINAIQTLVRDKIPFSSGYRLFIRNFASQNTGSISEQEENLL